MLDDIDQYVAAADPVERDAVRTYLERTQRPQGVAVLREAGAGWDALHEARRAGLIDGWVRAVQTPSGGLHLHYPGTEQRNGTIRAGTWRNTRHELDRMHLVTFATPDGQVAQRSATTPGQKANLAALDLPDPPRFSDLTVPTSS